jgi:chromosome partitioning protein
MVADDVRGYFGDKVYETVIPRNVRVSEAPSHGKPVLVYDMRCAGSQAYLHLASEVLRREKRVAA